MFKVVVLWMYRKEEEFLAAFAQHWHNAGETFGPLGMEKATLWKTNVPHVAANVAEWASEEAFMAAMKAEQGTKMTEEMKALPAVGFIVLRSTESLPDEALVAQVDLTPHLS